LEKKNLKIGLSSQKKKKKNGFLVGEKTKIIFEIFCCEGKKIVELELFLYG
jgi:hypothetical protein